MTDAPQKCSICGKVKPARLLALHASRKKRKPRCKACYNAYMRAKRAANPEAEKEANRRSMFKRRYGITVADYDAILAEQGGVCGICSSATASPRTKHFAVDHCHGTGKVRGLLCDKCNRGLGMLGDTLESVLRAAEYLRRNR